MYTILDREVLSMAEIKEMSSREARKNWRDVLDTVMTGSSDVAITRYGQAVAVIIPADDYKALANEIDELRMARMAEKIYEEYITERESAIPFAQVRDELMSNE
jgi:prevent-host-death family protein